MDKTKDTNLIVAEPIDPEAIMAEHGHHHVLHLPDDDLDCCSCSQPGHERCLTYRLAAELAEWQDKALAENALLIERTTQRDRARAELAKANRKLAEERDNIFAELKVITAERDVALGRVQAAEANVSVMKRGLSTLLADVGVMERAALSGDQEQPKPNEPIDELVTKLAPSIGDGCSVEVAGWKVRVERVESDQPEPGVCDVCHRPNNFPKGHDLQLHGFKTDGFPCH